MLMSERTDAIVKQHNDYCGVSEWHSKGWKGQGITVWNCEKQGDSHGKGTAKRVLDAAPECNLVTGTVSMTVSGGKVTRCEVVDNDYIHHDIHDWIKENNVKIITASLKNLFEEVGTPTGDFWQDIARRYKIAIINSAGNDGDKEFDFSKRVAWLIGALTLVKDKPKRTNYSSTGDGLDFMEFTARNGGTSCAAPYFAGKCALALQKHPEFTPTQLYEYMRFHCEDLEVDGEDDKTGWGLPIFPKLLDEKQENDMKDKKTDFVDVESGRWSEEAIAYCVKEGIMQGMGDGKFAPTQPLTREQAAQMFYDVFKE